MNHLGDCQCESTSSPPPPPEPAAGLPDFARDIGLARRAFPIYLVLRPIP